MKKSVLSSVFVGIAFGLGLAAHGEPPAPGDFTILPWGTTSDCSPETLKGIKDCGFNLAGFVSPENVEKVRAAGLQCLVIGRQAGEARRMDCDQATADAVMAEVAKPFLDDPAVFGYYIRDEPGAEYFPVLGRFARAVETAHPGACAYINLFPNYASAKQLGTDSYEAYLEQYVQEVKPKFVSYDHYALMSGGVLRDGYFRNLEATRKAAFEHNLPFWNIVLGNAHFTYAEPSPAGLRFQMFTTLAHGARGISYFTYFTPDLGNYRLACIDRQGNRTATWDMIREVNLMIHAMAPVYCTLKSVNVFHHPNVPEGCASIDSALHTASVGGKDMLVGEFADPDGVPYVMVVNKSLSESTSFDIDFKKDGNVEAISPWTGNVRSFAGECKWLAPGQGQLLRLR